MAHMDLTIRVSTETDGRPGIVMLQAPFFDRDGDIKTSLVHLKIANRDIHNDKVESETGCFLTLVECNLLAESLLKAIQVTRQEEGR